MNRLVCYSGFWLIALSGLQPACSQTQRETRPEPRALVVENWPAGVLAKNNLPKNRAFDYDFSGIETETIEKWLKYVGVKIPVKVSGTLSGWVWAQRSERGWLNLSGYRIEGQIVSPRLRIEQWEFKEATLRFGYVNNAWYVGRLAGDIFAANGTERIGNTSVSATLPTNGDRLLQISGAITQTQLKPLLDAFNVDIDIANESGNVSLAANVPIALSRDPSAWKAIAAVNVDNVRSQDIPRSSLSARVDLSDAKWVVAGGKLTIIDQPLSLDGEGSLDPQLPYSASISGSQLSLTQLLRAAKQPELTTRLIGNVDLVGKIQGRLNKSVEAASFALRTPSIAIDGEVLNDVRLEGVLNNWNAESESLEIKVKSASYAAGDISGRVGWSSLESIKRLVPEQAQIELRNIDLSRAPTALASVPLRGLTNGRIEIHSKYDVAKNLRDWSTDSQFTVDGLSIAGTEFDSASLQINKPFGEQTLVAQLEKSDNSLQAKLAVTLSDQLKSGVLDNVERYNSDGTVNGFTVRLPFGPGTELTPLVATGKFELRGTPKQWLSDGHVELSQLDLYLKEQFVQLTSLVGNIREDAFRLERFEFADENAGKIAGSALVRRNEQGEHLLNLRISDVNIEPYVTDLAPTELHGLTGSVNLETRLSKKAISNDLLSDWNGHLRGDASDIAYRSSPIGNVSIEGDIKGDSVSAEISGSVLGGELSLAGTVSRERFNQHSLEAGNLPLSASIIGLDLKRLMSLIVGPRLAARYSGTASLQLETTDESKDWNIRMNVPSFHYGMQELAKELTARLLFRSPVLIVENVNGRLAGGRIDIRGELNTDNEDPTGVLRFTADQLDLQSLVTFGSPAHAKQFSGAVSYRGTIQVRNSVLLAGHAHFKNAIIYGLPIQDLRNDLSFDLSLRGALKEVTARKIHGIAIGGRFDGEAEIRGGSRYSFDANGRIGGGKLDQLSHALGFENIVGTGSFDAATRLTSKDAFDIGSLSGPMQLNFTNGDVKSVPVLSELGRIVPVLQFASTDIKNGTMYGQFGQGQFRIPVLLLNSDAFYLAANGSASLRTRGLDFDGLLQTGGGIDDRITQSVTQKLFASAFPELLLLSEVNDLVRNRTIYFHVAGTPKHPVIQPKAAQTLAKGLLQNLSRNLLVIPSTAALSTSNSN